jgi:hypothetical protein
MSADTSDLDGLMRDLRKIPADMVPKLKGVVSKSALNTKKIMQSDARKSRHFNQLSRAISYDLNVFEFGGDGVIEGEVGPTPGGAGSLAGLAYYGSSKPGGGTVRNPEDAMLEEAPNFYEYAFKATEGLL